jgi:hypothetical protein
MSIAATAVTDAQIFAEVIAPDNPDMAEAAARSILTLHFSDSQNARMRELAEKNNRGTITNSEQAEMESYRRVGHFFALIQAKARLSLQQAANQT